MPSAEIITIGTEILLGEIVDTNTRYIARVLRGLGVDLYRTITIGDNVERIASAIHSSMQRAEIVITTGGLGPTVDDPTREAVAKALGVETEFREDLWEQVVNVISRYGRKPSENQKRQAYVPQGAIEEELPEQEDRESPAPEEGRDDQRVERVEPAQQLEQDEGETFGPELVLSGARERLGPILMTALTTGLALVPLAITGNIPGQEIEYPMAIVILGGLLTSTLLNLLVVPTLYLRFAKPRGSAIPAN